MVQATVTVRGTRPLLWHHFGPESISLDGRAERTGVAGNDPEEWRKTVLVNADGQLYLEPTYIFGSIRNGAKFTKKGRGSLQADVAATLQVLDPQVLVDRFLPNEPTRDPLQSVYLDVRSVRNPKTRGSNIRYRVAAGLGWTATFTILWDRTIITRSQMEAILNDAGTLCGLGDGRNIGFGRFTVKAFAAEEYGLAEAA